MASGGFRSHAPSTSNTTDFLEEWKAKREKMRAKMYAAEVAAAAAAAGGGEVVNKPSLELNNNNTSTTTASSIQASNSTSVFKAPPNRRAEEEPATATLVVQQRKAPVPDGITASAPQDEPPPPSSQETPAKVKDKAKTNGPSARKGKGQIEKRKLREKRRSTGVVNIPSQESHDEDDEDEAGQKERKREDTVTQENTVQNESFNIEQSDAYLQQETARTVPNRYRSTTNNNTEEDITNRYPRPDRTSYNRYNKEINSSVNPGQDSNLEKKIEELERELAKERQENMKLVKIMQEKEDIIMKMKDEIDLLNRDLDDIEDENKQLKQENKTLLKVVGQLTR
ncbi:PRKC apoptosis WT1 regulator protein [Pelobates fuscus]|uniref:PRKC apoptosis WT1 regulator protein n=1 Tax=Pelobates fuscus TaxID=191477 RepID=UPI002FE47709